MREATLWFSGAALAFFVTAGAFLLLANLGTRPSEKNLPPVLRPARSGPALELNLDEGELASLRALPDQRLDVGVKNQDDEVLTDVNLTLEVSSENTALSDARYYRKTVDELAAGRSTTVSFYLDLSPPAEAGFTVLDALEPPRTIVEVRATTPSGVVAVKTALLPLQSSSQEPPLDEPVTRAKAPGAGVGDFKPGSFTRPTRPRASSLTSTALPRSVRASV